MDFSQLFKVKKSTRIARGKSASGLNMLKMDLIKDEIPVIFDWNKHWRRLAIFVVIGLILVAQIYLVLYFWERQEIKKKTDNLAVEVGRLNQEIAEAKDKASPAMEFIMLNNDIAPVFVSHVYWNNFFAYLEKNTLADVFYSEFSGSLSGPYLLHAGTEDYRALSEQVRIFSADENTVAAKTDNEVIAKNEESAVKEKKLKPGVMFDFVVSVKPELFTK